METMAYRFFECLKSILLDIRRHEIEFYSWFKRVCIHLC